MNASPLHEGSVGTKTHHFPSIAVSPKFNMMAGHDRAANDNIVAPRTTDSYDRFRLEFPSPNRGLLGRMQQDYGNHGVYGTKVYNWMLAIFY